MIGWLVSWLVIGAYAAEPVVMKAMGAQHQSMRKKHPYSTQKKNAQTPLHDKSAPYFCFTSWSSTTPSSQMRAGSASTAAGAASTAVVAMRGGGKRAKRYKAPLPPKTLAGPSERSNTPRILLVGCRKNKQLSPIPEDEEMQNMSEKLLMREYL
jgi:hypothetical protein